MYEDKHINMIRGLGPLLSKELTTNRCWPVIQKSEKQILHYAFGYLSRKSQRKFARWPGTRHTHKHKRDKQYIPVDKFG